jgi:hypothetical protein
VSAAGHDGACELSSADAEHAFRVDEAPPSARQKA